MQINLNHCQQDCSGKWLLTDVLDSIQYQAPEAWISACRVASGLDLWIDEGEVMALLTAHDNQLEKAKQLAEQGEIKKKKEESQVLYAYDKTNESNGLKYPVGRTTLDHEQMTFTNLQFKDWVQRQLNRLDLTVKQREDLAAANYLLAQAETITIKNGI